MKRKFSAEDILTPVTGTSRPTQLIAPINNDVQRPDRIKLLYQSILIASVNDRVHCDILLNFGSFNQTQSSLRYPNQLLITAINDKVQCVVKAILDCFNQMANCSRIVNF